MPDYKESAVTGTQYDRFSVIHVNYPLGAIPTISCTQQRVISLESGQIVQDVGGLNFQFDPDFTCDLLNPQTGEPLGQQITGAQVFAMVWSYVMSQAVLRDAAVAEEAAAHARYLEHIANQPPFSPAPPLSPAPPPNPEPPADPTEPPVLVPD